MEAKTWTNFTFFQQPFVERTINRDKLTTQQTQQTQQTQPTQPTQPTQSTQSTQSIHASKTSQNTAKKYTIVLRRW